MTYHNNGVGTVPDQTKVLNKHSSITEKHRRNGKLQSCEPCRRSKLRCDHMVPACGRCVRRGKVGQCFYHPNPLTKKRLASPNQSFRPSPTPTPSSESLESSSVTDQAVHSVEVYEGALISPTSKTNHTSSSPLSHALAFSPTAFSPDTSHAQCQAFHRAASAPPLDYQTPPNARRNTGFQGELSHLSILKETLCAVDSEPAGLDILDQHDNIVVTNARITQGCKLLATLQNRSMITHFVQRLYEISHGSVTRVMPQMMMEWLNQLWAVHGDTLASQEPVAIRKLSERIWRNTLATLNYDGDTTVLAYAQASGGLNLRWEVIGLICSMAASAVLEAAPTDHIFDEHQVTRSCLGDRMKETIEKCLEFCRYCEVLDDLFVWLLLDYAAIVQATKGDRPYATYRVTGEALSAVIAMGLHQEIKANKKVPFFLAELRKRTFIIAYFGEISLATCLGRPTRLSYRYSNIQAPLDLSDAELAQTGAELEATLARLDENGYNTAGVVREVACIRVHTHFMQRREDIVDLALGQYTREEVLARADCIRRKNKQHLATLPLFMQQLISQGGDVITPLQPPRPSTNTTTNTNTTSYATASRFGDSRAADMSSTKSTTTTTAAAATTILSPIHAISRATVRICYLSIEILLQRVLIRRTGASSDKLTQAARTVFSDVLQLTSRNDIAVRLQSSYNMYLGGHGLRSAAIVAIELLKQEMAAEAAAAAAATGQQQHQSWYDHYQENPPLPRSQTIQDLAVFASRLAAVDESDGSYLLCEQGHRVITKILDRILEPKSKIRQQRDVFYDSGNGNGGHVAAPVDVMLAQTQTQRHTHNHQTQTDAYPPNNNSGNEQASALMTGHGQQQQSQPQSDQIPLQTVAPVQMSTFAGPGIPMASDTLLGYSMMDLGIGLDAPLNLGQDEDFMALLQGMDWGRVDNWTI